MAIENITNPGLVAGTYANTARNVGAFATPESGNKAGQGPSFAELIRTGAESAIDTMHKGEKASAEAITGKADLADVVDAVNAAETTLRLVVSLRDRLVQAYQEIMRLPI